MSWYPSSPTLARYSLPSFWKSPETYASRLSFPVEKAWLERLKGRESYILRCGVFRTEHYSNIPSPQAKSFPNSRIARFSKIFPFAFPSLFPPRAVLMRALARTGVETLKGRRGDRQRVYLVRGERTGGKVRGACWSAKGNQSKLTSC